MGTPPEEDGSADLSSCDQCGQETSGRHMKDYILCGHEKHRAGRNFRNSTEGREPGACMTEIRRLPSMWPQILNS
ncbi:MAG: hypothetical protein MZV63_25640 [Marinilabiliales bacterium]|nr:hypothetical protein [Marinilabiliales bacterium]